MKVTGTAALLVILAAALLFSTRPAHALGECGLSCCIAGTAGPGMVAAENFGLSVVYEYSYMETIRNGTREVTPAEAIEANRQPGGTYKVPTKMVMQKATVAGTFPVNERLSVVAYVPYVINDMDMLMRMRMMGMDMDSTMEMDTVSGLGDVTVMGLYTLYTDAPVRPGERVTAGFGVKMPTGKTGERTPDGTLVHAMMQPGSGSWDPVFMVNYMRGLYPVVVQAGVFYQLTTEGYNGYEFGDQAAVDLRTRYQASDYVNVGLDVNYIHAEKDEDHEGAYSRPATSMVDNTENTGLDSVSLSPVLQVKLPGGGGSGELRYQHPVYQRVNGYQQVLDWRVIATLSWGF